jgi:hypothetical protein
MTSNAISAPSAAVSPSLGKAPRATIEVEAVEVFDLGPRDVHPWHRPALPSHDDIKASPHYPVVVTANPMAGSQVCGGGAAGRAAFGGGRRGRRGHARAASPTPARTQPKVPDASSL